MVLKFTEDRHFLEDSIRRREIEKNMQPTISSLLSESGKRFFFQSACQFRDIQMRFVQMYCQLTEDNRSVVEERRGGAIGYCAWVVS